MLSKNQVKLINSLKRKKFRQQNRLFIAEGVKVVEELVQSDFILQSLYATSAYFNKFKIDNLQIISDKELKSISEFSNPNQVFGLFEIPEKEKIITNGFTLVLDEINDPGNLGTIIRLCDWFGVDQLVCSLNTVDCFNPKVVQASMGSLSRVSIVYSDLIPFLEKEKRDIFGAILKGENVYKSVLPNNAILIMGNEANGISDKIQNLITKSITIPQFGTVQKTESLNVATATAILLSEFRR
ncbi:MAG: RNA methyltransferase [Flavobacteriaceae bacterium]|nr:RNA methyltransferase [Flavobacteriaceae bacterium]